jgi:hypothetical protein
MPSRAKVLERLDVVVGEELREPVAPIHGNDCGKGVELQGSSHFRVGHQGA